MNSIPKHVAIIMDGNGRWAKKRGLKRSIGHLEGSKTLEKITSYIFNKGVEVLSVFAFSCENFKRSKEEVDYLMDLFEKMFTKNFKKLQEKDIKIVFSKKESGLPERLEKIIDEITEKTKNNTSGIFNICINYGGQDEIVDTIKKISEKVKNNEIDINDINKELVEKNLYNELPSIDLLIRTSGEYRVSNFMLWQMSYAEMYFPEVLFPDFNEKHFDEALEVYNNRDRRYGKIKDTN